VPLTTDTCGFTGVKSRTIEKVTVTAEMAGVDAETAFIDSMNNVAGDNSNADQIDSSDEYDPAQTVQDVSLPEPQVFSSLALPPNTVSRPASALDAISTTNTMTTTQSKAGASVQASNVPLDSTNSPVPQQIDTAKAEAAGAKTAVISPTSVLPKARLPHDRIGILEDRIQDDEKGDTDAWLSLINEHVKRGKLDDARNVYKRFFKVFPTAVC